MSKSSSVLKDQLSGLADKVRTTLDDVGSNETLKKAGEFTHSLGKRAEGAKKAVGDAAESIGKSGAFKVITFVLTFSVDSFSLFSIYVIVFH